MAKPSRDEAREERIIMEIIVDAYGSDEQAMGWYSYLQDMLHFPFTAVCVNQRRTSPLKERETITVVGMASADDCEHEMFVDIEWNGDTLSVPLMQIESPTADEETQQAIADWHYWIGQGYEFG